MPALVLGVTALAVVLIGSVASLVEPAPEAAEPAATAEATTSAISEEPEPVEAAPAVEPTPEPEVTEAPKPVMPTVAGLRRRDAEAALLAAGIGVRELRQVPSAQPKGTVLRQARQAGSTMATGASVVLVVASPYPRVPAVVGRAKSDAVSRLQEAGFRVTVTTETRSSGEDGVVLSQSATGRLKPGAAITVAVSSVVRPVAPPPSNCTSGYDPCLPPASDYDCAGGSGDGPAYAEGPIYVTGSDPYGLDSEGDGIACE